MPCQGRGNVAQTRLGGEDVRTYRFEIFLTAWDIALPVPTDLATTAPLARALRLLPICAPIVLVAAVEGTLYRGLGLMLLV